MNSIARYGGNDTWLVLGGRLLAAFPWPTAPSCRPLCAVVAMLLRDLPWRRLSNSAGATPAPPCLVDIAFPRRRSWRPSRRASRWRAAAGHRRRNRAYAGGLVRLLTPFSALVGVCLIVGYALLARTWLIMKSEGTLQVRCYRMAFGLGIGTILAIAAVSAATPFQSDVYWQRWFAWPQVLFTAQVPLLVTIAAVVFFASLMRRHHYTPFLMTLLIFTLSLAGLGISCFPYSLPPKISSVAAAPDAS